MYNYGCELACPKDHIAIQRVCYSIFIIITLECHQSCATCFDTSRVGCVTCESGKYLWKSQCLNFCPSGSYISDNICQSCNSSCSTCTSLDVCTKCAKKYYLRETKCVSDKDCPQGEYPDQMHKKCKGCSIACLSCYGGTDRDCLECNFKEGYIRASIYDNCEKISCGIGTYLNINTELKKVECLPCNETCKTCSGGMSTDCTTCISGLALLPSSVRGKYECQKCPTGFEIVSDSMCGGNIINYYRNLR